MKGVKFGNKHSYVDYSLVLTEKVIGLPTPKTSSVNVEGRDGTIDTSEVLTGDIKFNNRKLSFSFAMTTLYEEYSELVTKITNAIHGRKLKIVLDEDDSYYYYGRCSINQWSSDKRIGRIVIECDCEPYKYMFNDIVKVVNIVGDTYVNVIGKRMQVNPTIITHNSDITVFCDNVPILIPANSEVKLLDVFIKEGTNTLLFSGEGKVTIKYKGGEL